MNGLTAADAQDAVILNNGKLLTVNVYFNQIKQLQIIISIELIFLKQLENISCELMF